MTIVYAIAVLGVLAIVFGLILAVAAKVFEAANSTELLLRRGDPGRQSSRYRLRPRRPRECRQDRGHHGHGGSLRRQDGGARAVQRRLQRQG